MERNATYLSIEKYQSQIPGDEVDKVMGGSVQKLQMALLEAADSSIITMRGFTQSRSSRDKNKHTSFASSMAATTVLARENVLQEGQK